MTFRIFLLAMVVPLMSAEPAGYKYWSAQQLLDSEQGLKTKGQKVASVRAASFGNHYALLLHREGSGQAELHQRQADIMMIQSGSATLIVGGTIVKAHATTAGEIRGPSIEGGTRQRLAAGDIVHIAAKTPHQLLLDAGQQLNYFTLKVNE